MIDLDIRKAGKKDKDPVIKLTKEAGLFVPHMKTSDFFVAYRGENLVGVARLRTYKKYRIHELSNVGVKDGWRKAGIGSMIVSKLIDAAKYDMYLNTVNPGFYEKLGFISTNEIPVVMKKKKTFCKTCDKTQCKTMVKKIDG
jgi:N-acetylglutamate synthase-like GNAT family acetyltransferase